MGSHGGPGRGFTLVELLVVIAVVAAMVGILLPALAGARRQARAVLGISNQRQVVAAVNAYAADNDERYPDSTATITMGSDWHWQEPRMMTACKSRPGRAHRSMSEFLLRYIPDASVLFCPSAPRKYKYSQQSWDAGDLWDNPETSFGGDPVFGTWCFYWNYVGYLGDGVAPFVGPRTSLGGPREGSLLLCDYFGFGHHRSPYAFGSCQKMPHAEVTPATEVSAAYWSGRIGGRRPGAGIPNVRLHAGYIDGHVGRYTASEAAPMKVSIVPDGGIPYPDGVGLGPGDFYLPPDGLR